MLSDSCERDTSVIGMVIHSLLQYPFSDVYLKIYNLLLKNVLNFPQIIFKEICVHNCLHRPTFCTFLDERHSLMLLFTLLMLFAP